MSERSEDFLSLLSYLLLRHGRPEKATHLLQSLKIMRPNDAWTNRSLAYALLLSGDYQGCLHHLDRIALTLPEDTEMRLIRSRALWGLGREDEAKQMAKTLKQIKTER